MASVFVYGSMIWGMFPTDPKISWEGHFSGFMIGVVLAFYFRKKGPKPTTKRISDENVFNEWKYGEDYWKPCSFGEFFEAMSFSINKGKRKHGNVYDSLRETLRQSKEEENEESS